MFAKTSLTEQVSTLLKFQSFLANNPSITEAILGTEASVSQSSYSSIAPAGR